MVDPQPQMSDIQKNTVALSVPTVQAAVQQSTI